MSRGPVRLAIIIGLSLSLISSVPASAAPSVTLKKVTASKASYKGSVTVKPRYSTRGSVQILSARLTVKKGRKTVGRNRPSVRLKAGTYSLTQTVRYRSVTTKTREVVAMPKGSRVRQYDTDAYASLGDCRVNAIAAPNVRVRCEVSRNADFAPIRFEMIYGVIDEYGLVTYSDGSADYLDGFVGETAYPGSVTLTADLTTRQSYRAYGRTQSKKRNQRLVVRQDPKPRGCATRADYRKVRTGDSVNQVRRKLQQRGSLDYEYDGYDSYFEARSYKVCNDRYATISVSYEDGLAYSKYFIG